MNVFADIAQNSKLETNSLPDSVKVARRPVKPLVLVRVQVWQPIYGRQADISWLRLSRKQGPCERRSEHYRRLPPFLLLRGDRGIDEKFNFRMGGDYFKFKMGWVQRRCDRVEAGAEPCLVGD